MRLLLKLNIISSESMSLVIRCLRHECFTRQCRPGKQHNLGIVDRKTGVHAYTPTKATVAFQVVCSFNSTQSIPIMTHECMSNSSGDSEVHCLCRLTELHAMRTPVFGDLALPSNKDLESIGWSWLHRTYFSEL